jgi:hypothetical protein
VRLWSLHPRYLDPAGLVALWRETLLAQAVLGGRTRGYVHHPQLVRFREQRNPTGAIAAYLHAVADEADRRAYAFDRARIDAKPSRVAMRVTSAQLRLEWEHLKAKLQRRNNVFYDAIARVRAPLPHPSFSVVRGAVADWERLEHRDRK